MPAQKLLKLFIGYVEPTGIAQRVRARVFALQQQALEHLPPDGPELIYVLSKQLVDVVRVHHRVDLERDFVLGAPFAHLVQLGDVVGARALQPADFPVRVGVERIARHGQHVHVIAVPAHPRFPDQAAVAHYRHADVGPLEFCLAILDQLTHEPTAVLDERLAAREVELLHTLLGQHGQPSFRFVQRQHERRFGRVKTKTATVVALSGEMVVDDQWDRRQCFCIVAAVRVGFIQRQYRDYGQKNPAQRIPRTRRVTSDRCVDHRYVPTSFTIMQ